MALETVYWIVLAGGLGLLVLSLLVGDLFDAFDFELGTTDIAAGPVFFASAAAFGAGGILGLKAFEFGAGGSIYLGLGTGLSFGALTALLFSMLRKQEAGEAFDLSKLVGARGTCSVAIGPGRVGRVSVQYAGMSRALSARSQEEISVGEEVVVRDVIGSTIAVSRAGTAQQS